MRITGGDYKNRKLYVPEGQNVRPTSDRMRQTIFNLLHHSNKLQWIELDKARVLDIFCGSGALGLEALSHGAEHCIFIDRDISAVTQNTEFLDKGCYQIHKGDALKIRKGQGDINLVFMDPPYSTNLVEPTIKALIENEWLEDGALFVIETERGLKFDKIELELIETRHQSQSSIHFLSYDATI